MYGTVRNCAVGTENNFENLRDSHSPAWDSKRVLFIYKEEN
jgi:hypothetical protein